MAIGQNRADLVRVCLELEERQLATDLLAALPDANSLNGEYDLLSARSELALAEDRPADALPLFREAYGRWVEFGVVIEQGYSALGWGRAALALDDWSEAEQGLRLAREIFSRLKARPILARIDALLEETIRKSS